MAVRDHQSSGDVCAGGFGPVVDRLRDERRCLTPRQPPHRVLFLFPPRRETSMRRIRRALSLSAVPAVLAVVAAAPLRANDPASEKVVFTGASATGSTSITFSGNKYSFSFIGDETLTYQLALADP